MGYLEREAWLKTVKVGDLCRIAKQEWQEGRTSTIAAINSRGQIRTADGGTFSKYGVALRGKPAKPYADDVGMLMPPETEDERARRIKLESESAERELRHEIIASILLKGATYRFDMKAVDGGLYSLSTDQLRQVDEAVKAYDGPVFW